MILNHIFSVAKVLDKTEELQDNVKFTSSDPSNVQFLLRLLKKSKWSEGLRYCTGFSMGLYLDAHVNANEGELSSELLMAASSFLEKRNLHTQSVFKSLLSHPIFKNYISIYPVPGSIMFLKYPGSTAGHSGIVIDASNFPQIITFEGNTSIPNTKPRKYGLAYKKRDVSKLFSDIELMGFLTPLVTDPNWIVSNNLSKNTMSAISQKEIEGLSRMKETVEFVNGIAIPKNSILKTVNISNISANVSSVISSDPIKNDEDILGDEKKGFVEDKNVEHFNINNPIDVSISKIISYA